jgi:hypothetical protein
MGWRRPGETDAVEKFSGRDGRAVNHSQFGAQGAECGKPIGLGVGGSQLGKRGERLDGGDEEAAEAGRVGELTDADARARPETDGLGFIARADEGDEGTFEEQHIKECSGGRGSWLVDRGSLLVVSC